MSPTEPDIQIDADEIGPASPIGTARENLSIDPVLNEKSEILVVDDGHMEAVYDDLNTKKKQVLFSTCETTRSISEPNQTFHTPSLHVNMRLTDFLSRSMAVGC